MRKRISILLAVVLLCFAQTSKAAVTPLAVSIVPPVQFPQWDVTVAGVRASALVGSHRSFYGLDFGVIGNITDQAFGGLAVSGIFNLTRGSTAVFPFQIAGITNINSGHTTVVGAELALGLNSLTTASSIVGLQFALVNRAPFTTIYGLQLGIWNEASDVYGFQIGLLNFVDHLHGFQLGFLNFNKSGLFGVCPAINFGI